MCIYFFSGQQHLGFNAHQRRYKQDKFAGQLDIQRSTTVDVRQEIVDEFGNGNVVNIEFVTLNKKQEQVEGAFKLRQLYLVRGVVHRLVVLAKSKNTDLCRGRKMNSG